MSDINTYADEAAITALSNPINGDLVLNQDNNSVYLCTNAELTGLARWKSFANDGVEAAAFLNRWGASFNGTNEYLECGNISELNSANACTVSAWFKLTPNNTSNNSSYIFSSGTSFNAGVHIYLDNGSLSYVIGTGNTYSLKRSYQNYLNDAWHHIAGVFYDSTIELYMDGISVGAILGTSPPSSTVNVAGEDILIGARYDVPTSNYSAQGLIDEVAVFNSALTSPEVASLRDTSGSFPVPADISSLNPLGYWRMGDDSNDSATSSGSIATITDSSGNGNDATQATASSQPTFKALAQSTTSLDFSLGDYLDCGGASEFSFTDGGGNDLPFSISAWVKLDSVSKARVASKDTGTSNREYLFGTNAANNFNMLLGTATVNLDVVNTTTLNTTDWYHVVATYDGSKSASGLKVYVNADASSLSDNSAGSYSGMTSNSGNFEIGRFGNGHSFFNGLIDEVAVFNSELPASDVASLAASRGAHIVNDLSLSPVAYYLMGEDDSLTDGASASQITDASGNGNHATQATASAQPTASVDPVIYV